MSSDSAFREVEKNSSKAPAFSGVSLSETSRFHSCRNTESQKTSNANCSDSRTLCTGASFQGTSSTKRYWDTVLSSAPTRAPETAHNSSTSLPLDAPAPPPRASSSSPSVTKSGETAVPYAWDQHSGGRAGLRLSSATIALYRTRFQLRKFKCHLCPLECERRGHLEQHLLAVHRHMKQFHCPYGCTKPFGHRSSLARHIKNVHGRLADKTIANRSDPLLYCNSSIGDKLGQTARGSPPLGYTIWSE
jgi:Zinc finger, C2H2 type